jgi:hypothetical protein
VQQNGEVLGYVPEELQTAELCLAAVRQNEDAMEYVTKALKAQVKAALEKGEAPEAKPAVQAEAAPAATIIVPAPAETIAFRHHDGWKLDIKAGDTLGRTQGEHSARLGGIPVISGIHARVTRENGAWFVTDLKSSNGTRVNGEKLAPNTPARIKNGDAVSLANIAFTLEEQ